MSPSLSLFGAPSVAVGDSTILLPFAKRTQLAAFLGCKSGWVGRSELVALLWPDQDSELAYANLRKALFRLRALPWGAAIESQAGALRFTADTDIAAFETALSDGRIDDALAIRRGELLAGFEDPSNERWNQWLTFERARLAAAWRSAVQLLLDEVGEPERRMRLANRLLDDDPLDEAAVLALMEALTANGQGARARDAYRGFAERLQRELGLAPSGELTALHDSLGVVAPAGSASRKAVAADDGFVGRVAELRRILALLTESDCRLLTISGPGGVGKTRLAQRATAEMAPSFPDGAVFVPLDDLVSTSQLGARLARELGVSLSGRAEALEEVIETLRERRALLALDNFEELGSGAGVLNDLLTACPHLKLIITSRIRTGLAGEWLLPLEGLPTPEAEDEDRAEAFDAVRLFIRAAQRISPGWAATSETPGIVEICRQVEGLPLALEFAASWTRVLSCAEIAHELRHGTDLLRSAAGGPPARHASMGVVFDQSWRLLTDVERDGLARLSIFRGGISPEAARVVAGAALPVLRSLADKSLLRKDDQRLHMHPLVQQLAAARLDDASAQATRRVHAAYFLELFAQLRVGADTGEAEALKKLDREFENFRLAWNWTREHGPADAVARSIRTLVPYFDHRGRFGEGLTMLQAMLESPIVRAGGPVEATLLAAVAQLEYRLDRYDDAEATATRTLALAQAVGDHDASLRAFKVLGVCCLWLGRHGEAKHFLQQALKQAPAATDPLGAAAVLDNLALVEKGLGHFEAALKLSLRALAEYRRLGAFADEALALNNLGAVYLDRRDPTNAAVYLRQGLSLSERHGLLSTRVLLLANLANAAVRDGRRDEALAFGQSALEAAEAAGNRVVACWVKLQFARIALERSDIDSARADLSASLTLAIALGRPSLQIQGLACFASVLAAQCESASARRVLDFAQRHPRIGGPEREEIRTELQQLQSVESTPGWPAIEFDELLKRIVAEAPIAYATLIAELRAAA